MFDTEAGTLGGYEVKDHKLICHNRELITNGGWFAHLDSDGLEWYGHTSGVICTCTSVALWI